MIKNYLKIAFRNLLKQRLYSLINIFGLAVGIACCILIGLYVQNELSFDTFHEESDRIYRAWVEERLDDGTMLTNISTPVPLRQALLDNIPEVEAVTYLYDFGNLVRPEGANEALDETIHVVHEDFFRMFDFELLQGDASTVFSGPGSVVLTREAATRFFGEENPMQKTLSIRVGSEFREFIVTGLIESPPANSSIQHDILIPDQNIEHLLSEQARQSWFQIYGYTMIMLREGVDPASLEEKMAGMMQGILGEEMYAETDYTVNLQPMSDIYLSTDLPSDGDPVYSWILGAIALLILLIACVNFMTLSISKSASRAREVGIRKTVGALRQHLMYQFWGEALLLTVLALGLGITVAEMLLPMFNDLSGTTLQLQFTWQTAGVMGGAAILVSLIAGIYPALILSGFRPVEVLKGRLKLSADKSLFRQSMVVIQFALSIALITGTFIVQKQLSYVSGKDLGFEKEQVVVLESGFSTGPQVGLIEVMENGVNRKNMLWTEAGRVDGVESITSSTFTPVQTAGWFNLGFSDDQNERHSFHGNIVDADFIPTLGIEIVQGRNFSAENPSDELRAMIVNEAMVEYFGWENPIGQRLPGSEFDDHEIIGVVENFHFESLHTPVEPLAMAISPAMLFSGINNMSLSNSPTPRYSIKLNSEDLPATMAGIREVWEGIAPGTPFDFTFVDEALDRQYRQEQRLGQIVTAGSILAIIIACLGLFGLASLMVVRRTKEIGVRKVLGASSKGIVLLVNREFTRLVLISFLIGAPLSWYFMRQWLQNFSYRTEIGIGLFLLAGALSVLIAWVTVSYQSWKATRVNPVDSLRSE